MPGVGFHLAAIITTFATGRGLFCTLQHHRAKHEAEREAALICQRRLQSHAETLRQPTMSTTTVLTQPTAITITNPTPASVRALVVEAEVVTGRHRRSATRMAGLSMATATVSTALAAAVLVGVIPDGGPTSPHRPAADYDPPPLTQMSVPATPKAPVHQDRPRHHQKAKPAPVEAAPKPAPRHRRAATSKPAPVDRTEDQPAQPAKQEESKPAPADKPTCVVGVCLTAPTVTVLS